MHFWRDEVKERESRACFRLYVEWKVRVVSPSFRSETDSEQSLWHSLETNAEDEHTVNKYDREEKEKYRLRIASERGDDDDYDDVSDEHDSTKDCSLQSSLEGATGAKNRVYRLGLYIYGQWSIPPQPEAIRGPGEASGTSHSSAIVANFRLMCETSAGEGGFAWTRARTVFMIDDAVEQDPRLPCRVGGGRRWSTTIDETLGDPGRPGATASAEAGGAGRLRGRPRRLGARSSMAGAEGNDPDDARSGCEVNPALAASGR